jgi:hypothetical protein
MNEVVEIRSIGGVLLWSGAAESLRIALERAMEAGANLREANLRGANLCEADLSGADLRGANLCEADLSGADLREANLREANLSRAKLRWANLSVVDLRWANLSKANLVGANLCGASLYGASLSGADLREANLGGANLRGAKLSWAHLRVANLREADLSSIREDLYAVLAVARAEAPGLLTALRDGRVEGSAYEGPCACLIGTIANLRGEAHDYLSIALRPDSSRPAEVWFLAIAKGDTPATSPVVAITVGWIEDWLREHGG